MSGTHTKQAGCWGRDRQLLQLNYEAEASAQCALSACLQALQMRALVQGVRFATAAGFPSHASVTQDVMIR